MLMQIVYRKIKIKFSIKIKNYLKKKITYQKIPLNKIKKHIGILNNLNKIHMGFLFKPNLY